MVIFVFGMPGSGKSTYIKENFPEFKHVAIEKFQRKLPFGCTIEERDKQMKAEYEECRLALIEAIRKHENVVLEHTLLKAMRRTPYIDAVRSVTDQEITAYVFNPGMDAMLRMRGMEDTESNRERISQEKNILEMPTPGDGFAKTHIITEEELPDLSEYTYSENDSRYHTRKDHAKKVIIPADVKSLKHDFYGWGKVEKFHVEAGNEHYADVDGVLFDITKTELIKYPEGRWGDKYGVRHYKVPDGVIEIAENAFADYSDLFTRFTLPPEVYKQIGDYAVHIPASVEKIGHMAFNSGTRRLEYIWVDEDNKNFASQDGILYDKNLETLICFPAGNPASYNRHSKRGYTIPETVKKIEREGFSGCVLVERVILPDGLLHIGSHAFEECISLLEITVPGAVKEISPFAFSYCFRLTNVTLGEGVERIDSGAFAMCNFLKNMFIPKSVTEIDGAAFSSPPSLTIHCYEGSYAHSFAQERGFRCALVGDTIPEFSIEDDATPGLLRIDGESLEDKLMGDPEIAGLLSKIAGMAGPIIVSGAGKE